MSKFYQCERHLLDHHVHGLSTENTKGDERVMILLTGLSCRQTGHCMRHAWQCGMAMFSAWPECETRGVTA